MNASPSNPLNPCSSTSHSGPFLNSKMLYTLYRNPTQRQQYLQLFLGILCQCILVHFRSLHACAIEPELPPTLTSYYAAKYMSCTVSQVLRLSRFKLSTITCSKEQASFLEKSTRGQSSSVLWFDHQKGCITSSVVGSVVRFQFKALARVKSILQYSQLSSTMLSSGVVSMKRMPISSSFYPAHQIFNFNYQDYILTLNILILVLLLMA